MENTTVFTGGAIYFNKVPVAPDAICEIDDIITIGNSVDDMKLEWVKVGNKLVAAGTYLPRVSYAQLDWVGLIKGKVVSVDGVPYLCRSLQVGTDIKHPGEWDEILKEAGDLNTLWHWGHMWFWGQDCVGGGSNFAVCRGRDSADGFNYAEIGHRSEKIGFRPVLEPLPPAPALDDSVVGKKLKLYFRDSNHVCTVKEISDYDLVVSMENSLPQDAACIQGTKENAIVDRSAIIWSEKV